jgi:large subunit ribosomal protein L7/L12
MNNEDLANALGNLSIMELLSLTKQLEDKWALKATPVVVKAIETKAILPVQEEFTLTLLSVPSDKKIMVIKAVKEILSLGLKESKDFVDNAPRVVKDLLSLSEVNDLKNKLEAVGAVVEVR